MKKDLDPKDIELNYIDEEGDKILISSDDCLAEAMETARKKGTKNVKVTLSTLDGKSGSAGIDSQVMVIAGGGVALLVGIVVIALLRPKK